jgi:hypothetical protein
MGQECDDGKAKTDDRDNSSVFHGSSSLEKFFLLKQKEFTSV